MKIPFFTIIALFFLTACTHKDDTPKKEWPVSGVENIDTEWFKTELNDSRIRYVDSDHTLLYSDGGIIHSTVDNDGKKWHLVDISTGTEITFTHAGIDEKTKIIRQPTLEINGTAKTIRHAKLEKESEQTLWISMSTTDKSPIVLVVDKQ